MKTDIKEQMKAEEPDKVLSELEQKQALVKMVREGRGIADNPPNDGRQWYFQCARCGSSVEWHQCGACGGEGMTAPGELYEQDPLWYDQDDSETCHQCNGDASWGVCISSPEYCEANPITGRAEIPRGKIEWFTLNPLKNKDPLL